MRPDTLLIAGLLILAIFVAIFFATNSYHHRRYKRRYDVMKEKFVTYLDDLDRENEGLQAGKIRIKPKKDYKKLL